MEKNSDFFLFCLVWKSGINRSHFQPQLRLDSWSPMKPQAEATAENTADWNLNMAWAQGQDSRSPNYLYSGSHTEALVHPWPSYLLELVGPQQIAIQVSGKPCQWTKSRAVPCVCSFSSYHTSDPLLVVADVASSQNSRRAFVTYSAAVQLPSIIFCQA